MTSNDNIVAAPDTAPSVTLSLLGAESTHEVVRYTIASAIALTIDTSLLWVFTDVVGFQYIISGAIGFAGGLTAIYFLSTFWVFAHRHFRNARIEFVLFSIIGFIGLGINEMVLYLATDLAGFHYLLSKLISVFVVFAWNFGARKLYLFR